MGTEIDHCDSALTILILCVKKILAQTIRPQKIMDNLREEKESYPVV